MESYDLHYVHRMLTRRETPKGKKDEQIIHWLNKLAVAMQPDWLTHRRAQIGYRLSTGLLLGLPCGLIAGFDAWLLTSYITGGLLGQLFSGRKHREKRGKDIVHSQM